MPYSQYTSDSGITRLNVASDDLEHEVHARLVLILSTLESGNIKGGLAIIRRLINRYTSELHEYPLKHTVPHKQNVISMPLTATGYADSLTVEKEVKIYTMGRFSVLRKGQPLQFRTKAQKKPLDLLKVIISLGGRAVSKPHIAELLWPDSEGDAAVSVVNTTLSRLRKLVGKEAILTENGRITLNQDVCWVDCWELEKALNAIKNSDHNRNNADEHVRQALSYYQGSYLGGDDDGWSVSRRERIRSRFLHTLSHHGQLLVKDGECECAIALYNKVLEIDDLNEEFYLNLMRCQIRLGHNADAILVYQRCKQALNETLGIEPSQACTDLYRSLIK